MTEPIQEPERPGYRFPVVAPEIVEFEARLEPFSGAPQGFAGSLEELLDHLRAGSLDLRTLPLAPLIEQYLDFLQRLPQATMDTASEFLPLAATLIHLKSQLLVPSLPQPDQERSVREAVLQHIAQQEQRRREEVAPRPTESDKWDEPQRLSLLDLMVLLRDVQNQSRRTLVLALAELTVEGAMRWLRTILPLQLATAADQYWEQQPTKQAQGAVFLAILELVRTGSLACHQSEMFGPLWIWTEETSEFLRLDQTAAFGETAANFFKAQDPHRPTDQ